MQTFKIAAIDQPPPPPPSPFLSAGSCASPLSLTVDDLADPDYMPDDDDDDPNNYVRGVSIRELLALSSHGEPCPYYQSLIASDSDSDSD